MAWTDYADLTRDELIALLIQRDHTILDLQQRVQILEQNVKRLEDLLDQARRGGKRQASGPAFAYAASTSRATGT